MALSARGGDRRRPAMGATSEYLAAVVAPSRSAEHHEARVEQPLAGRRGRAGSGGQGEVRPSGGASHWQSESSAANRQTVGDPFAHKIRAAGRQDRAASGRGGQPHQSSGATEFRSTFGHEFGLHADSGSLSARAPAGSALAAGTAKATGHLPGYQGFLPASARAHRPSTEPRNVIKGSIADGVRLRPVGYGGHVPSSAKLASEFRLDGLTTAGKDFVAHKLS
mmetsp:Transcript_95993/g.250063  ORF Transcript_95993/g.250063 Transcript_95993/m.250063 type:complete len:223 (+) Transcript_95993:2-670(+)